MRFEGQWARQDLEPEPADEEHRSGTPGKRTRTQRLIGHRARRPATDPAIAGAAAGPAARVERLAGFGPVQRGSGARELPGADMPIDAGMAAALTGLGAEALPVIQRKVSVGAPVRPEAEPSPAQTLVLAGELRRKMERSFRTDFSSVRLYRSPEAVALGAQAFTRGDEIHFAPGHDDLATRQGEVLLGHELAHVVQQRAGRVSPDAALGRTAVSTSSGLELEADAAGERAASGEPAQVSGAARDPVLLKPVTYAHKNENRTANSADELKPLLEADLGKRPSWAMYGDLVAELCSEGGVFASARAVIEELSRRLGPRLAARRAQLYTDWNTLKQPAASKDPDYQDWWAEQLGMDYQEIVNLDEAGSGLKDLALFFAPDNPKAGYLDASHKVAERIRKKHQDEVSAQHQREQNIKASRDGVVGKARKALEAYFPDADLSNEDDKLIETAYKNAIAANQAAKDVIQRLARTYPGKANHWAIYKGLREEKSLSEIRIGIQGKEGIEYAPAQQDDSAFASETRQMIDLLRQTNPDACTSTSEEHGDKQRVIGRLQLTCGQIVLRSELAISGKDSPMYGQGQQTAISTGSLMSATYKVTEPGHTPHPLRHFDAEVKLLEWVETRAGVGGIPADLAGCELLLYTTALACPSCQDLMHKFKKRYKAQIRLLWE